MNTASSKVRIINHKAADSTHSYKLLVYNSKIIDRTKRESWPLFCQEFFQRIVCRGLLLRCSSMHELSKSVQMFPVRSVPSRAGWEYCSSPSGTRWRNVQLSTLERQWLLLVRVFHSVTVLPQEKHKMYNVFNLSCGLPTKKTSFWTISTKKNFKCVARSRMKHLLFLLYHLSI